MDAKKLETYLEKIAAGKIKPHKAAHELKSLFSADLGYAHVDHHRAMRCGFPEVIYCPGKSADQVEGIAMEILAHSETMLATRISPEAKDRLCARIHDAVYNEAARIVFVDRRKKKQKTGMVTVISAGTSDIPVAEEARVTAELMGAKVQPLYDVGVAGIHRLLNHVDVLKKARVHVVVAGMEGALASVVGGLVDRPVIAVPTSVGYGTSLNGIAALLSMLNSCASNVSVVNIDNGFSAGTIAALMNRT
ncbi:MAG: nickel pincer cofactor biosynthesis protein LarB [Planctomycetes bacterium]|nr:nickel pincer cofactor biosynthesis protein LarB [Planctomycetota bacterium]